MSERLATSTPAGPGAAARPATSRLLEQLLQMMADRGASDLHLSVGHVPRMRLSGRMEPMPYRALTEADFEAAVRDVTPPAQWKRFQDTGDALYAWDSPTVARFRVSLFRHERGSAAVFRIISKKVPALEQLGLPDVVHRLTRFRDGLVLVTGPRGSGKTTTLAALTQEVREARALHVISLEQPTEFIHRSQTSVVTQREVGVHAPTFSDALAAAMREDPDVLVIGELTDTETMRGALAAAEMGLLVFASLDTVSAKKAIERIFNLFPPEEQDGVRGMVADVLRGVLSQQLVPAIGGGRVAAVEVLFGSSALAQLLRDRKTQQIPNLIQMGKAHGMIEMDDALLQLLRDDKAEAEVLYQRAVDKKEMRKRLRREFNVVIAGPDDDDDEALAKLGG